MTEEDGSSSSSSSNKGSGSKAGKDKDGESKRKASNASGSSSSSSTKSVAAASDKPNEPTASGEQQRKSAEPRREPSVAIADAASVAATRQRRLSERHPNANKTQMLNAINLSNQSGGYYPVNSPVSDAQLIF